MWRHDLDLCANFVVSPENVREINEKTSTKLSKRSGKMFYTFFRLRVSLCFLNYNVFQRDAFAFCETNFIILLRGGCRKFHIKRFQPNETLFLSSATNTSCTGRTFRENSIIPSPNTPPWAQLFFNDVLITQNYFFLSLIKKILRVLVLAVWNYIEHEIIQRNIKDLASLLFRDNALASEAPKKTKKTVKKWRFLKNKGFNVQKAKSEQKQFNKKASCITYSRFIIRWRRTLRSFVRQTLARFSASSSSQLLCSESFYTRETRKSCQETFLSFKISFKIRATLAAFTQFTHDWLGVSAYTFDYFCNLCHSSKKFSFLPYRPA